MSAVIAPTLGVMSQLISGAPRESMNGFTGTLQSLNPARRQEGLNLILYAADLLTQAGDLPAAVDCAKKGVAICRDTGLVLAEMETQGLLSVALCEHGRLEQALAALQAARDIAQHIASPKLDFHHLLIEAYIRLKLAQRDRARELLRQAFVLAREQEFLKGYLWAPRMMAHLCNEALDAGIEPAHVRRIIGTRKLPPPDAQAAEAWPWPVKIYVLGRFEILLDGQILRSNGKAQKKPLELVRALVARGPGDIDQSIIAQDLWPDSEGDAAESAARMTVHRLRKLLRHEDTILVQEGKLRLNPERCWVDAWALERACRTLEADGPASKPRHWMPIERVLKLYQGKAFGTEVLQPWMLAARDRWRSKFLRAVRAQGGAHEQRASWREAADLYQAGIETDPLCEEFYQALMRCQIAQDKQAEACDTYRRCRDILSVTLGIKPSAATESLRSNFGRRGAA